MSRQPREMMDQLITRSLFIWPQLPGGPKKTPLSSPYINIWFGLQIDIKVYYDNYNQGNHVLKIVLYKYGNLLKFLNLSNKAKRCLPSLTNKLISIAIFLMAIHKIHKPLIWSRYQAVHCTGYIRGDSEHQGNDCWLKPHWSVQQN